MEKLNLEIIKERCLSFLAAPISNEEKVVFITQCLSLAYEVGFINGMQYIQNEIIRKSGGQDGEGRESCTCGSYAISELK